MIRLVHLLVFLFYFMQSAGANPVDMDSLFADYRYLHQHPELSLQEKNTAAYLVKQLTAMGYQVATGIGGTGLVAVLANGKGPVIMYRTDMDALPVAENTGLAFSSTVTAINNCGTQVPVMHACGHDVHMTVWLGVAQQMMAKREQWRGTLILVAEPAEEIGAGARAMLNDGLYSRFPLPDYNLAFHVSAELPVGQIGYVRGYALANVDSVDITVHGVGGHGAYPHKTRDPIVVAARIVMALQSIVSRELSPLESAVVSIGSIHGGTKHNIIPDEVKLQLTVRSYSDETRELLLRRIKEISQGIARSANIAEDKLPEIKVKEEYTPAVYNDPELLDRVLPVLRTEMGRKSVISVKPVMAGEDFARYGRTREHIPGVLLWLGEVNEDTYQDSAITGEELPPLHSSRFAPDAKPAITTGVRAMQAIMLDLFATP